MATHASFLSPLPRLLFSFSSHHIFPSVSHPSPFAPLSSPYPRTVKNFKFLLSPCLFPPPFEEFEKNQASRRSDKKSVISDLIQEIEPLDVTLIQKDVPPTTLDAMKRTISGMLGLLPSDRFQVSIEALWELLSKLLVSSIMTGYTLHNAEYRLCLERNLDIHEGDTERQSQCDSKLDLQASKEQDARTNECSVFYANFGKTKDDLSNSIGIQPWRNVP